MTGFLDGYEPIEGVDGEYRGALTSDVVLNLLDEGLIPGGCNGATVSSNGNRINYTVNKVDPTHQDGRPIPDGDEIILTNRTMVENFRGICAASGDTTRIYIQFYKNA